MSSRLRNCLPMFDATCLLYGGLNQWKNTDEVITWFNNVEDKQNNAFIWFDVCEFYPSITEELLDKALDFAKNYTTITKQDRQIIMQTKQSLLYNDQTAWCKKNSNFDVTMGSFDGAETCELVRLYMLSQLEKLYPYSTTARM